MLDACSAHANGMPWALIGADMQTVFVQQKKKKTHGVGLPDTSPPLGG